MLLRRVFAGLVLAITMSAAEKKTVGRSKNDAVEMTASVFADKASIKQLLGSDLDGYFVVVDVKLAPKGEDPLAIQRDDFLLRTDKDGERAKPFVPSQIAGRGALVVSQTGGGRGMMADNAGPVWGGYPGSAERPRRLGGDGGSIGNASGSETQANVSSGSKEKDNPLKAVLEEKMLPEKKTDQPVSGLLYFPIEAKQKIKDLELIYASPGGKMSLRFR